LPVQEKPVSTGNGLLLVVSDLHAPNQDDRAFKALLQMMADNQFAELILLGDAVELASLAWFGGPTTLQSYADEAKAARAVLKALLAHHSGPVTLVCGNHDLRPDQKVERTAPQLHGSIKDEIGWSELGVRLVPENAQPLVRGKCLFIHGHQDCGRTPPLRYAWKLAQLYGTPGSSVVAGHCHRDQSDSKAQHGGPVMGYILGTLEKRPHWLKTADSWTCSIAVADPESGIVQVLPIREGVMWYGSKRYG
jgi:predicted phosphodiesterase